MLLFGLAVGLHVLVEKPARAYLRRWLGGQRPRMEKDVVDIVLSPGSAWSRRQARYAASRHTESVASFRRSAGDELSDTSRPSVRSPFSRAWLRAHPATVSFVVAFSVALLVVLLRGETRFYYDARVYWGLGDTFSVNGSFSLLNFSSPLRGYLLPLAYHVIRVSGQALTLDDPTIAGVFNAATLALIATVLAPALAHAAWPHRRWGLWRRLGLTALLLIFWRGYLSYPLSDFPAFAAALLAIVAVSKPTPARLLVAGLFTAAAIDLRPAYLLLAPIVVVLVAMSWWPERGAWRTALRRWMLCAAALLFGFVIVSLPQSLAMHRYFGTWSFIPGAPAKLTTLQFTEGMRLQRYDTYVGTGEAGPSMRFEDRSGARLVDEEAGGTIETVGEFLGVVAGHPITAAGVFGRHVINGLDQRYDTPYIKHLDRGENRWLRLAGFLLVFLALLRVLWPSARRRLGEARWRFPVALLLCGATAIASAVEARFLLPAQVLAYVLVLAGPWPNPLERERRGVWRYRTVIVVLFSLAVFMAFVLSVVTSTTDSLRFA